MTNKTYRITIKPEPTWYGGRRYRVSSDNPEIEVRLATFGRDVPIARSKILSSLASCSVDDEFIVVVSEIDLMSPEQYRALEDIRNAVILYNRGSKLDRENERLIGIIEKREASKDK